MYLEKCSYWKKHLGLLTIFLVICYLGAVVEKLRYPKFFNVLVKFWFKCRLKFSQKHNFLCYISNIKHRLFPISPSLHLLLIYVMQLEHSLCIMPIIIAYQNFIGRN